MVAEKVHIKEIIGGRFDNSFVLYHHKTSNYKYPVFPLFRFLTEKPQYGAGEAGVPRTDANSPRYIRITDIDDNGLLLDGLGVTAKNVEEKYILQDNDILIARSGNTVGKSYIHKAKSINYMCFFAGYMIRFVVNRNTILPEYVFLFTKLSVFSDWVKVTQRVTGQPNINADEYSRLPIPVPSVDIQQKMVDLYSNAQAARLRRNHESKQLLNSIDDYLLKKLYIDENINREDNKQPLIKKISTIIGQRLDVSFYTDKFEMVSTKYANEKLVSLVNIDPTIRFNNYDADMPISFIPMECIDEEYGMISETREKTISQTKGYTRFEENDLLWAKITPCMQNGKSAIARHLKNGMGCGSTEYYVMRPKSEYTLIDYIYIVLRNKKLLEAAKSSFGGSAGQQRVSSQYLKSIMIPHPDISIQKEIVDTVYNMRYKAKQLQKEGDALLEEAKQKIEKLIIG